MVLAVSPIIVRPTRGPIHNLAESRSGMCPSTTGDAIMDKQNKCHESYQNAITKQLTVDIQLMHVLYMS